VTVRLSVVIPTYNRCPILMRVLHALADQHADVPQLEVIVVDDGSTDETATAVPDLASRGPFRLLYLQQPNLGPAAARNRGIGAASGDLVLFIGDDILARPGLLKKHREAHLAHPQPEVAVLGLTSWHPELEITPLAQWWEDWRFRYRALLRGKEPDFSFFYTHNVSVKRDFLLTDGLFDESFPDAAYEDTELACRLLQCGLKVVFEPQAAAYHHHQSDLATICRQMEVTGRSYDLFIRKTGQLGLSQLWTWLGTGPWMQPWLIRPLWHLAEYLQTRRVITPLFIAVLMYFFQVGRGKRPPLGLPGNAHTKESAAYRE
jgi:glycosyltransferase involved in cell wall biosynthesis